MKWKVKPKYTPKVYDYRKRWQFVWRPILCQTWEYNRIKMPICNRKYRITKEQVGNITFYKTEYRYLLFFWINLGIDTKETQAENKIVQHQAIK